MKVAVDVTIGRRAIEHLVAAGHHVVAIAEHGESDRDWFARAMSRGAEVVISADVDLAILAYDARIEIFKPIYGERSERTVARFNELNRDAARSGEEQRADEAQRSERR